MMTWREYNCCCWFKGYYSRTLLCLDKTIFSTAFFFFLKRSSYPYSSHSTYHKIYCCLNNLSAEFEIHTRPTFLILTGAARIVGAHDKKERVSRADSRILYIWGRSFIYCLGVRKPGSVSHGDYINRYFHRLRCERNCRLATARVPTQLALVALTRLRRMTSDSSLRPSPICYFRTILLT